MDQSQTETLDISPVGLALAAPYLPDLVDEVAGRLDGVRLVDAFLLHVRAREVLLAAGATGVLGAGVLGRREDGPAPQPAVAAPAAAAAKFLDSARRVVGAAPRRAEQPVVGGERGVREALRVAGAFVADEADVLRRLEPPSAGALPRELPGPGRAVEPDRPERIYRRFAWGQLVDLIMLDTRLVGRDQQASNPLDSSTIYDERRTLLGFEQITISNGIDFSHQIELD